MTSESATNVRMLPRWCRLHATRGSGGIAAVTTGGPHRFDTRVEKEPVAASEEGRACSTARPQT